MQGVFLITGLRESCRFVEHTPAVHRSRLQDAQSWSDMWNNQYNRKNNENNWFRSPAVVDLYRCAKVFCSISIPDFSPQFATFFPGTQIAPVGISDPTFSSRSDLWYVPTLRTFLLYKCFFYSEVRAAQAPVWPAGKSVRFPGNFPAIPGKFPRDFPAIPGKFPR